ncbi:MAG: hypothetical protein BWY29_00306 [Microgenomates group bacterium ADurb.Bin238]|nr:MAG: hypothetical protein BWY29_00306 [Microgenomates group bacterium ADurb.Bin238]
MKSKKTSSQFSPVLFLIILILTILAVILTGSFLLTNFKSLP